MISPLSIQRVQQAADILDVVQDYVFLKKKGTNYWACCPFHSEKTPSFSVSPAKGIFKCFGCGKGGDAITFIREIEGVNYVEAIRMLARKYNIELEEDEFSPQALEEHSQREKLYIVLSYAKNFFQYQLQTPEGKTVGIGYLKERGFKDEIIQKFELGYAPNSWDTLKNDAQEKGYSLEILQKAGLITTNEQGHQYDCFRGRVIFPIHNLSGRPIAFGARTLKKDEKPKYINSPETEVYKKSEVLYGIFQAKNAIRQQNNCYLVEGYTDVISMHQAGVENVVASSGTSLTEGQIQLIKRFTNNITILYDGDTAGIKASLRGIDMFLSQDLNVSVVLFPDGEDPDSFIQKRGAEAFQKFLLDNKQDFIQFKAQLLLRNANSPQEKAFAIRSLIESVVQIPNVIKRSVFQKEIAKIFKESEEIIVRETNRLLLQQIEAKEKRTQITQLLRDKKSQKTHESATLLEDTPSPTYEHEAVPSEQFPEFIDFRFHCSDEPQDERQAQEYENLRILVLYGYVEFEGQKLYNYLFQECNNLCFTNDYYASIYNTYAYEVSLGNDVRPENLIHHPDERFAQFVVSQLSEKHTISPHWEKQGIVVPKKDEKIDVLSYRNILKRKFAELKVSLQKILEMMKNAKTPEEEYQLLELYEFFNTSKRQIAQELGIVIG
ncbi:MAG: DNA primase [Cytophagales bacterium]|nr:DNA primase [Cytophagales bacterium]MDW8383205.1 DNA primase [Flammeovirgaceae bacterium]